MEGVKVMFCKDLRGSGWLQVDGSTRTPEEVKSGASAVAASASVMGPDSGLLSRGAESHAVGALASPPCGHCWAGPDRPNEQYIMAIQPTT